MSSYKYGKTYWAQIARYWANASAEEKARAALDSINRRQARKGKANEKPKVVVIRAQGKPLFVFVCGLKFVSSFTWDRLQYKAVYGPWQFVTDTTLKERLP